MREIYNKNIFEPNEVDKLREEIHGLKLENETLKIQAIERKKSLRVLRQHKTMVVNSKIDN